MKQNKYSNVFKLTVILLSFLCCLKPKASLSEDLKANIYYKKPNTILTAVSRQGANTIVTELYNSEGKWNYVLRHIASGDKSWLRVAVVLHTGSDAGASEMLNISVGEALGKAPENVFSIVIPEFTLESICGAPDVDDVRFNSYGLAMNEIKKRQDHVISVSTPKLKNISKECNKILRTSKGSVEIFYRSDKSK